MGTASVDAVVGVTAPVSALLILYRWAALSHTLDPARLLRRAGRWRPTLAAALAAVPGCAGGIAVSRLFLEGGVDQGDLLAAHLATSGDASFVLLVARPQVALLLFALAFVVGAAAGTLLSRWAARSGCDVLPAAGTVRAGPPEAAQGPAPSALVLLYYLMVALTGAAAAARLPAAAAALAAVGLGATILAVRATPRGGTGAGATGGAMDGPADAAAGEPADAAAGKRAGKPAGRLPGRSLGGLPVAAALAARDAAEITLWVFAADVAFAMGRGLAAGSLQNGLQAGVLAATVAAALVGAIPGCGPQIFLARLFIAGGLPLPAVVANTVGQHGDAIFPLLARDRKAALAVTVLQAALAVVVGIVATRL